MINFFKKGISTPIAIGIILVLAVLVGGFTIWQYSEMNDEIDEEELGSEEIESYLKILSPNRGEELLIGDTVVITWEFSGIDKIDIGYRREGSGAEVNGWIGKNVSTSQDSYSWTITEGVFPGPEYKQGSFEIIIQETPFQFSKSKSDKSDSYFTIVRENEILKDEITGWNIYRNLMYSFEVKYPDQFSMMEAYISEKPPSGIQLTSKNKDYFKGSIWVRMFAKNERKSNEECISKEQNLLSYKEQKIINSIIFYHFVNYPEHIGGYCGMSSGCHYKDIYRAFYNDNCYQIEYSRSDREFIEGNPYDPESEVIGDVEEIPELFNQIFFTFRFLD